MPVVPRAVIAWQSERAGAGSSEVLSAPSLQMDSCAASLAFRPAYRLCKTDEFSSVFAFRKAVRGRYFILHYRPSGGTTARFAVVVAKKLARHAVLRNLIKRMGREQFRQQRAKLPCHDLILRLNAPAKGAGRTDLRQDMAQLFKRLPK